MEFIYVLIGIIFIKGPPFSRSMFSHSFLPLSEVSLTLERQEKRHCQETEADPELGRGVRNDTRSR